jgi:hypothetical protein
MRACNNERKTNAQVHKQTGADAGRKPGYKSLGEFAGFGAVSVPLAGIF